MGVQSGTDCRSSDGQLVQSRERAFDSGNIVGDLLYIAAELLTQTEGDRILECLEATSEEKHNISTFTKRVQKQNTSIGTQERSF